MLKDMPEWMKHVTAGGKATYGRRTNLSMKEQRQSLPIFNLKKALLQVGVVIVARFVDDGIILLLAGYDGQSNPCCDR